MPPPKTNSAADIAANFASIGATSVALSLLVACSALDNKAALTPPMGWLSWQRYRCAIGCNNATSPDCFNEQLIRDTADAMVALGYKDAGYEVSPCSAQIDTSL